jgi:signal transduction histidine kinase
VVVWLVNNGKTEKIEIELEKENEIVRLKIIATGNNTDLNTREPDENSQIAVLKEKVQLANGTLSVKSLSDRESIITIEL